MRVYELRYPGTWLDHDDDLAWEQVHGLLMVLENHLAEAAVGVAHFQEHFPKLIDDAVPAKGVVDTKRVLTGAMERRLPQGHWPTFQETAEINQLADLMTRRLEWAKGNLPRSYTHALVTIYAHAVVYALDGIEKSLCQLARVPCLAEAARARITAAHQAFTAALPAVRAVRDSAHHREDRARGMGRNDRELDYQPIAHEAINAPAGHNVLIMSALSGNSLGYTTSDGHYREVEISHASVKVAQAAIQQAIEALQWKRRTQTTPR
jgi:hypothetical protein